MAKRVKKGVLPQRLFCDASFLVAYFAPQDHAHKEALKVRDNFLDKSIHLYTSWPTISETSTLLFYHYGYSHAVAFLGALSAFHLIIPSEADYYRASALFEEFNRDQSLSFNDALTYVLIRGPLKEMPVVTFDSDFAKVGLTLYRP